MVCHGNNDFHCCWINGQVCLHLEERTVEGRRWACGLLRELGTWDAVYQDPRYQATTAARSFQEHHPGYGCGDWPQNLPDVMANGSGLCCYQAAS
jgi:hypothetical protein